MITAKKIFLVIGLWLHATLLTSLLVASNSHAVSVDDYISGTYNAHYYSQVEGRLSTPQYNYYIPGAGFCSTPTSLKEGDVQEQLFALLRRIDMSPELAASFLANLYQTSRYDPSHNERGRFGIAGWSDERKADLKAFAESVDKDYKGIEAQAMFIKHEIENSKEEDYRKILSSATPDASVEEKISSYTSSIMINFFDVAPKRAVSLQKSRSARAKTIYDKLKDASISKADCSDLACSNNSSLIASIGGVGSIPGNVRTFLDTYAEVAYKYGSLYGIPYEAVLAQGGLESGWGGGEIARASYNIFSIKKAGRPPWDGPTISASTREVSSGGQDYLENAEFRKYSSPEESFEDYYRFIHSNSNYKEAVQYPTNDIAYIDAIARSPYATDPNYGTLLRRIHQNIILPYIEEKGLPRSSSAGYDQKSSNPWFDNRDAPRQASGGGLRCSSDDGQEDIVKIAKQELAKGVVEDNGSNCGKGINKYWVENNNEEDYEYCLEYGWDWQAAFVSWVYNEAGRPLLFEGNWPTPWNQPSVYNMRDALKDQGKYFLVGEQTPQPGDIAFYIKPPINGEVGSEHVNIVIEVNGDTMTTIGGNESGGIRISTRPISPDANYLEGFARP